MDFSIITSIIKAVTALLGILANMTNLPLEIRNQAITIANQAMQAVSFELRGAATSTPAIPPSSAPAFSIATSSRAIAYNVVSSDPGPAVTKIIFDPDPLTLSAEKMAFWVWITDADGVADASAVFDINSSSLTIPLKLTNGTTKSGVWSGEWQSPAATSTFSVYRTKFYTKDTLGNLSKVEMNWTNN